jgi:hypothetical protein
VEIVGFDFVWRDRAAHMQSVCRALPSHRGSASAWRCSTTRAPSITCPRGAPTSCSRGTPTADSSDCCAWAFDGTVVSALSQVPDHGQWALGTARLYVHRGTGHYGFPLRIGVPAERSLLHVHGLWREATG